ncbi:prolyl 4-hydroxylase subunit alpha-2 [Lingula anatina]|uniref:Prolyl 4-hydroxylase subunit alpha-2 n=1 Tax=Lingula anatina TaxID=7574 RepID=A0A1S3IWS8_LINAN|nr:prolyl 4-hydroxylase subunit alpha-2 [Lingula anatina]|eukprot:XP_013402647.1 prolyl 4-hydroxylase subunit alpha-2 [Lingula anatina]
MLIHLSSDSRSKGNSLSFGLLVLDHICFTKVTSRRLAKFCRRFRIHWNKMNVDICILCWLVMQLFRLAGTEVFTSMNDLQKVLIAEQRVAQELREHIKTEERRLQQLRRLADEFEEHSNGALDEYEEHLGNPVNAYLLLKKLTVDWQKVENQLAGPNTTEFSQRIRGSEMECLPDEDDLTGAIAALLRLQDTYNIPTSAIASGRIGEKRGNRMSAEDCFLIGRHAYLEGAWHHVVSWMLQALEEYQREDNKTADKVDILDHLVYTLVQQGNLKRAYNITLELLAADPNHPRGIQNKMYLEDKLANKLSDLEDIPPLNNPRTGDLQSEDLDYEAICRGDKIMENPYRHKLSCRYFHNNKPSLLLRPVKQETVYLNPTLTYYHDFLSEYEMDVIKKLAGPNLKRATVRNVATHRYEPARYRISKSAWFDDTYDPMIERVRKRISDVTGLSLENAEALQVANYGLGGYYALHLDCAKKGDNDAFEEYRGNRIATWINYMSDVEAGGATAFVRIGVRVPPNKFHQRIRNSNKKKATI